MAGQIALGAADFKPLGVAMDFLLPVKVDADARQCNRGPPATDFLQELGPPVELNRGSIHHRATAAADRLGWARRHRLRIGRLRLLIGDAERCGDLRLYGLKLEQLGLQAFRARCARERRRQMACGEVSGSWSGSLHGGWWSIGRPTAGCRRDRRRAGRPGRPRRPARRCHAGEQLELRWPGGTAR